MPKRLVVCCDGTWNTPDQKDCGQVRPSNVAKTALALARQGRDGREQVLYYDRGVGTGGWWDRLVGGAFGRGLGRNIKSAYRFLVEHYEEGDEIFFFGFSRGAYTVRSTAGLLRNGGLLRREHAHRLGEAYRLYRRRDPQSHPESFEARLFRRMYGVRPCWNGVLRDSKTGLYRFSRDFHRPIGRAAHGNESRCTRACGGARRHARITGR